MKRIWILLCALALVGCGGGGGSGSADSGGGGPTPDPGGGRVTSFAVKSTTTNTIYPIQVFVPESYDDDKALLPAIYVTESDAPYGGTGLTSRFDGFKQVLQRRKTRAILVGIGGTARRNTDFLLPTARNYLAFIIDDLIPQVEDDYRADPGRRALSGLSHGGYFVVAALVTEAARGSGSLSFSHYLSTDSSIGAHSGPAAYMAFVETELAAAPRPLNATLLLAGALADGTTNGLMVRSLYDRLVDQAVPGLTLQHLQLSTTHVGADMPAFEQAVARYFE